MAPAHIREVEGGLGPWPEPGSVAATASGALQIGNCRSGHCSVAAQRYVRNTLRRMGRRMAATLAWHPYPPPAGGDRFVKLTAASFAGRRRFVGMFHGIIGDAAQS
jgi:hypothetical protein